MNARVPRNGQLFQRYLDSEGSLQFSLNVGGKLHMNSNWPVLICIYMYLVPNMIVAQV